MPPTKHARLGASKATRWRNCPGSLNQSEGIETKTSYYATEGTAAHEVVERCLTHGVEAIAYLGAIIPVEEKHGVVEITVDEEMVEAVQVCVDHVMSLTDSPADVMMLEVQFDLGPLNPPGPMFGTSDITLWKPATKTLHVVDYKHGAGVAVDAVDNDQIKMYALGAVLELKVVPDDIIVWIVQPRGHHPRGPVRDDHLTMADLIQFKKDLFADAERTLEPDAPLKAGSWCRFCPALPTCPEQARVALEVISSDFSFEGASPALILPEPKTLGIEELVKLDDVGDQIMSWVKAVRGHMIDLLKSGQEVPGRKLVRGRANRKWKDPEMVEKALARRGLKVADRFTKKLVSPAQAEKALKSIGKTVPEDWWEKPEGKLKLAPADDARPEALPPAMTDFDFETSTT